MNFHFFDLKLLKNSNMRVLFFLTIVLFVHRYYVVAQNHDIDDQVILVQLELNEKLLVSSNWNNYEIENKRIMLHLTDDDPLMDIESLDDENEPSEPANCFIPSLKLIYKDYTYLISTLCNRVKKFENIKPFVSSDKELPTSATFSSELSRALEKYQAIFFGPTYKNEYISFAQKNTPRIAPTDINSNVQNANSGSTTTQNLPEDDDASEDNEIEQQDDEEDKEEVSSGIDIETDSIDEEEEENIDEEEEDIEEDEEEEDMPKKKRK